MDDFIHPYLKMKAWRRWASRAWLVGLPIVLGLLIMGIQPVVKVYAAGQAVASNNVYYVSPSGNDSNSGTVDSPWRTIQRAADAAYAGDTVLVRGGEYAEAVFLGRSGNESQWIIFKNYPGEVPVIRNPGDEANGFRGQNVSYVAIHGFFIRGFEYAGIQCGWDGGCTNLDIRYNILDENGQSGLGLFNSDHTWVEGNIASRNGWGPGWASGFDLWQMTGQDNVVRGNVAFNNVDESEHHTDGNGFILDLGYEVGGARFENNIAFQNGGAGIAVTHSSNVAIVGNTLFQNVQDDRLRNLCELSFAGDASYRNVLISNNVTIPAEGRGALLARQEFVNSEISYNNWSSEQRVNSRFVGYATAPEDMGFDSKCLRYKTEGQRYSWWHYEPNLDYVQSIGGIPNCFAPSAQQHALAPGLGASEHAG